MGNEETLGGFPVKQAVPILVCEILFVLSIPLFDSILHDKMDVSECAFSFNFPNNTKTQKLAEI